MAKDDLKSLGEEALAEVEAEENEIHDVKITEEVSPEPTPEEAKELVAQKKARIAQVMSRGIINEKLKLAFDRAVPDGYSGKFVRDTEGDIIRYENLGFGFNYREGAIGDHGTGDGRIRVGDVVLMTITLEDREILKTVKMERMQQHLGKAKEEYKRLSEEHISEGGAKPIDMGSSTNVAVGTK